MEWRTGKPLPLSGNPTTGNKAVAKPASTRAPDPYAWSGAHAQEPLTKLQAENQILVQQLRGLAHLDQDSHLHNARAAEDVEEDASTALIALSHVLQDHRQATHDLPLSSLQLMRVARSLVRLQALLPNLRSLVSQVGEDLVLHVCFTPAMRNARFAVWSGMLYGLVSLNADLGICTPPKLLAAADMAVELLSASPRQWVFFPGQGAKSISQLFWALAKLGYQGRQLGALVDVLEKMVLEHGSSSADSPLAGANAQDLSSLCWSLARLLPEGARCTRVWAKCLVDMERFMSDSSGVHLKPQDISNTVWAFATAVAQGMPRPAGSHLFLGAAAAAVAKGVLFHGSQQALANSMWALASLGDTKATDLALEAMNEMRQNIAHLSAQDISNLCWAFGTLAPKERLDDAAYVKHVLPMLHAVADRVAEGGLKGALSQNWANICWCFAALAVYIPKAFYACTAGLAAGIAKDPAGNHLYWAPIDFSTMLWACAHVGHDPKDPHLKELWVRGAQLYTDFPPDTWPPNLISHDGQDLGNLSLAWAVLFSSPGTRSPETDATARVIFDTAASLNASNLSEACLTALAQAHIEACDVGLPGGGVPAGPVQKAMLHLWAQRKDFVTCSEFQQKVAKAATAAGAAQVELEASTADGLFRVDVSCLWPVPESLKLKAQMLQNNSSRPLLGDEEQGFVRMCIECDGELRPSIPAAKSQEGLQPDKCVGFPVWQLY